MAGSAVGGELRRLVVGIGGLVVIVDMTAGAGIGGVDIISVVAGIAIIGNGGVGAIQWVE